MKSATVYPVSATGANPLGQYSLINVRSGSSGLRF